MKAAAQKPDQNGAAERALPSPASATATATRPTGSRRRTLWQLPPVAHELLLGLSFPEARLRQVVGQTLARLRGGRGATCVVQGSDADVLFSTVHDLTQRNAVSETFQRLLDQQHATAVREWARIREETALLEAWRDALDGAAGSAALAARLWSVLTHPLGVAVEPAVLFDARRQVYSQAQRSFTKTEAAHRQHVQQQAQRLTDAAELTRLKQTLLETQRQAQSDRTADAAELARLRGALAHAQAMASGVEKPKVYAVTAMPPAPTAASPRRVFRIQVESPPTEDEQAGAASPTPPDAAPEASPPNLRGRRVLCVGGINGAVHRYRELVEQRGGRFVHHDGGIEHNLRRLEGQLATADLVVCQAGCLNHEAYRCVKAHCKRVGTPCIYLDRPSLSRLARELGPAARTTA